MAKKVCLSKLKRELKAFKASPPPHVPAVHVNEANLLDWHFLLEGPPDSPYTGGYYIGKLRFPQDYPFAPPSIMMITPNGRFKAGSKICTSMSDFHPESWNPSWSVSTILVGLLSFMLEDSVAYGSIKTSDDEKRQLAAQSREWNLAKNYEEMFPQLTEAQAAAAPPDSSHAVAPAAESTRSGEASASELAEQTHLLAVSDSS